MHHFTAITWDTFPKGPARQEMWQLALPKLALEHDFLLQQLLAITASHMACLYPELGTSYSTQASRYQDKAIQGLRRVVTDITSTNCHAIFAAASLLSISAFATYAEHMTYENSRPTFNNLIEAFSLIRGMHEILRNWEPILLQGPIGQLLQLGMSQMPSPLLARISHNLRMDGVPDNLDENLRDLYQNEVQIFIDCIDHASSMSASAPELRAAMTWPIGMSDRFFCLLRERHPASTGLLDYYCRILERAGSDAWYVKGWGKSVLEDLALGR